LKTVEGELEKAVKDVTASDKDREAAAAARERANADCVETLGVSKRALGVPGLIDAAIRSPAEDAQDGSAVGDLEEGREPVEEGRDSAEAAASPANADFGGAALAPIDTAA